MKIKLKNTKLISDDKTPLTLYRSTPGIASGPTFKPLTHFGTELAAKMRTFHFVYQALNIPEPAILPNELPKSLMNSFKKKNKDTSFSTYSVHLYMKSPLRMPDINHHDLARYYRWFCGSYKPKSQFLTGQERMEGDVVGPEKIKYKKLLSDFIFIDPFTRSEDELKRELSADSLYQLPLAPHNRSLPAYLAPVIRQAKKLPFELPEHVAFGRLIHFLEGEGYDGFIYKNEYEDKGRDSYIIFRSEQVFATKSSDTEHEIPALTPENKNLLNQIEHNFFATYHLLSPSERIFGHNQMLHHARHHVRF